MRPRRLDINSKGFGLLGLILAIGIIVIMVFGFTRLNGQQPKNQIETGKDAVDAAKDAAEKQNESTQDLQNQLNDIPSVNYHGIQDRLKDIK